MNTATVTTPSTAAPTAFGLAPEKSPRPHQPWALIKPLMTPAVRVFAARSFGGRALIVSLLFLLPLLVLSLQIGWQWQQTATQSQRELSGLRYVRDSHRALQAIQGVLRRSLAADSSAAGQADLRAALNALQASQDLLGAPLDTAAAHQALNQVLQKAQTSGSGFATFIAYDRVSRALQQLIELTAERSGLALDSDRVVHGLVMALTKSLPHLSERVAQTATASSAALQAKAMTPLLQRVLNDNEVMIDFQFSQLKSSLDKLEEAEPALRDTLQTERILQDSKAFFSEVESAVTEATDLSADPSRMERVATQALNSQYALAQSALDAIEQRLGERIQAQRKAGLVLGLGMGMGLQLLLVAYAFYGFYLATDQGLVRTAAHLRSVMRGDLATPFKPEGADQSAELTDSLQDMQQALRAMVQAVRESAQQIVQGSRQIASAATDLSQRSAQTSASIEASAGVVQQISGTLRDTAESASQASALAASNTRAAQHGGSVVNDVVQTMREIEASSQQIADIIGLIDGIAFQTNILALNAAVEAARAGSQGRGFAVVASEVRSLAHRVTEAALQVKQLITASLERVQTGAEVAQGAGLAMQEMVRNAEQLDQVLARIASASREETQAVVNLSQAVTALSQGTRHDLQQVEQTATAASGLHQQSDHLITLVERFRLQ